MVNQNRSLEIKELFYVPKVYILNKFLKLISDRGN